MKKNNEDLLDRIHRTRRVLTGHLHLCWGLFSLSICVCRQLLIAWGNGNYWVWSVLLGGSIDGVVVA